MNTTSLCFCLYSSAATVPWKACISSFVKSLDRNAAWDTSTLITLKIKAWKPLNPTSLIFHFVFLFQVKQSVSVRIYTAPCYHTPQLKVSSKITSHHMMMKSSIWTRHARKWISQTINYAEWQYFFYSMFPYRTYHCDCNTAGQQQQLSRMKMDSHPLSGLSVPSLTTVATQTKCLVKAC